MSNTLTLNKKQLFGVDYSIGDYENLGDYIVEAARTHKSIGVSALAVHGLMEAQQNQEMKNALNNIDIITPDGQPVRWALNFFHKAKLKDRVYGPKLTWEVLKKANKHKLRVYLFGSTEETIKGFIKKINLELPDLIISGFHVDRFREATEEEDAQDIEKINASKPNLVLVGRGCPRQEIWVGNHVGKIFAPLLAVGAAFNFHAGNLKQAPIFLQNAGLEWAFRLFMEPKRLWKRYLYTNSKFILKTFHKTIICKK